MDHREMMTELQRAPVNEVCMKATVQYLNLIY